MTKNMDSRVIELLLRYVKAHTHTGTALENNNMGFFKDWFEEVSYLQDHPQQCGFYPVKNDPLGRQICYALLKGRGKKTIVMIHHTDTVDTEDFGKHQDLAYEPDQLAKFFESGEISLDPESEQDLRSGEWLFGRGVSDMKAGGSIHLAIFEEYARQTMMEGNLIILGVPDEENSSAGMRSAVYLLQELKEKYDLEYSLMLNGEPHERSDEAKITVYDGSAGKIMPVVYVRGKLAHVGQVFKGLNPIAVLSEIVGRTDLNPAFIEKSGNTATLPPSWLYFKDNKAVYDVSLPLSAGGYMSVLTLYKNPDAIMEEIKTIAREAFVHVLRRARLSLAAYEALGTQDYGKMEWDPLVLHFGELVEAVAMEKGQGFRQGIAGFTEEIAERVGANEFSRMEGSMLLIEKVLENWSYKDPVVVLAISPPYYPATSNTMLPNGEKITEFIGHLAEYSKGETGLDIQVQNYFTGISDLSYAMFNGDDAAIKYISENMLLWGKSYTVPLAEIREIAMPVLNLGPWGKDLHKSTERVRLEDLLFRIPTLTKFTIDELLKD